MNNALALNNPLSPQAQNDNNQLLENLTLLLKMLVVVDKCDCCKAQVLELKDSLNE